MCALTGEREGAGNKSDGTRVHAERLPWLGSVVMIGWRKAFCPGKRSRELRRIMDEHREVLGANPEVPVLEADGDERDEILVALAQHTDMRCVVHGLLNPPFDADKPG